MKTFEGLNAFCVNNAFIVKEFSSKEKSVSYYDRKRDFVKYIICHDMTKMRHVFYIVDF
jgi:hypothetical protein